MDKFVGLRKRYEEHFGVKYPERILGFFDPIHDSSEYIEEEGYNLMKKAVEEAIRTNRKFEEISKEDWETMIF